MDTDFATILKILFLVGDLGKDFPGMEERCGCRRGRVEGRG